MAMKTKQNKKRPAAEIIFSIEESPEGGFEAHALGHSIFTQADTAKSYARWFKTRSVAISTMLIVLM